jgi:hypothetical protein
MPGKVPGKSASQPQVQQLLYLPYERKQVASCSVYSPYSICVEAPNVRCVPI